MVKRLLVALVVAALVLPLAPAWLTPAAGQEAPDMGVKLDPAVSGNITFWHFWGSPVRRTAIRRIVLMCNQALPNIRVDEVFKPWGEIWTANTEAVAVGLGMPDVIVEDRPQLARVAADGIETDLQSYVDRDGIDPTRFWPFTWEQTLYEGDSYGIPFETDVRVLFYNKTLFAQAGLDANTPPRTWDDLWAYADKLDLIKRGTVERMGFFPLIGNVGPELWAETAGHQWVQDGRVVIDDPKVAQTLAWIKQWVNRYGGWSKVQAMLATLSPAPYDAFMTGEVAMVVDIAGYNSLLNFYRPTVALDDGSTPAMEWGVGLIPYESQPASFSGGFALSIPTGAANPAAAWEFIKCATSPVAQASWARDTYSIPSDIQAANDPLLMADPNWQFFIDAMQTSSGGTFVAAYPKWRDELSTRYERVWSGSMSVSWALQEAQRAVDETLAAQSE